MTFTTQLRAFVLNHGAVNNPYLTRFSEGRLTDQEFRQFAVQFFFFVKHFPRILAVLLANTPVDEAADELALILTSELGDGNPKKRHEYLYHKFLRSIGLDPVIAAREQRFDTTDKYIEGLASLYAHEDYQVAMGASFGLEHMAISMWDQLIPGIMKLKKTVPAFKDMNTVYWTFHRALEEQHEEAMMRALDDVPKEAEPSLQRGCSEVLNFLEGFWMGLEAASNNNDVSNVDLYELSTV